MAGPSPTEQGHPGNFTVESRQDRLIEVWDRNGRANQQRSWS
jgi:hypothetical protein